MLTEYRVLHHDDADPIACITVTVMTSLHFEQRKREAELEDMSHEQFDS